MSVLMLYNKNLKKIYHVKNVKIVYFDTRGQNEQWVNHPCGLMYRTIFFFTNLCEPELAHCLQTLKMHRNSTSLDSCQHDDINIVTVSVARRRWTAPLKPRRPCVKHFTTFYALLKPRCSTQVWALCSETRALREADISWFRHVASEKRACSLGMRCVTLAVRDSCAIFVSLAHRLVPPQRRGLWWTKWEKTASLRARDVLWY